MIGARGRSSSGRIHIKIKAGDKEARKSHVEEDKRIVISARTVRAARND